MQYVLILFYLSISFFIADKIGRHKTPGFWGTLLLCLILSPFTGYLIAEFSRQRDAKGCRWCHNKENEAEYCGLCGKNDKGEIRPGWMPER